MTNPRQTSLLIPPAANPSAPDPSIDLDYSAMAVGSMVGERMRVVACDVCGYAAITKHNPRNLVWLHSERISTAANGRTKRVAVSKCKKARFDNA